LFKNQKREGYFHREDVPCTRAGGTRKRWAQAKNAKKILGLHFKSIENFATLAPWRFKDFGPGLSGNQ
jgi:hypothetical protein